MRVVSIAAATGVVVAAAALVVTVKPPEPVRMIIVGDIMLSRNVAAKMREAQDPLLPFRNVSALLNSSDFNFGNLESPFAPPDEDADGSVALRERESGWDGVIGGTSLIFAAPNRAVQALRHYGFRIVTLGNNHALDQDEAGLIHTLKHLSDNNIQAVGAGRNLEEAWQARIVEAKGKKIAFLAASYTSVNDDGKTRNENVARIEDLERLTSRVHALKSRADFIVVAMHAGREYTPEPEPAQVGFAHAAIEAGANLVVGSHPHWIQQLERYRGGLICYSLGNFVFDLESSREVRQGMAVKVVLYPNGAMIAELSPITIENSCCARQATPSESREILRQMHVNSAHLQLN